MGRKWVINGNCCEMRANETIDNYLHLNAK